MRLTAETVFLGAVGVIMVVALIGGGESSVTANAVLESTPASIPWFLLGMFPLIALAALHIKRRREPSPAALTLEATIKHAPVSAVGREFPVPHDIQKILQIHPDKGVRTGIQQTIQQFNSAYQKAITATEAYDLNEKKRLVEETQQLLSTSEKEALQHRLSLTPTQIGRLAGVVDQELRRARETEIIIGLNDVWQHALEIPNTPDGALPLLKKVVEKERAIAQAAKEQKIDSRTYSSLAKDTRQAIGNAVERLTAPLLVDAGANAQIAAGEPEIDADLTLKAHAALVTAHGLLAIGKEYLPTNAVSGLEAHVSTSVNATKKKAVEWRRGELTAKARLGILDQKLMQEYHALSDQKTDATFMKEYLRTYREAGGNPETLLTTLTYDIDKIQKEIEVKKKRDKQELRSRLNSFRAYRWEKQHQKDERAAFPERFELDKSKTWTNEQVAQLMQSELRKVLMGARGEGPTPQYAVYQFIQRVHGCVDELQKDAAKNIEAEIAKYVWETYVESQLVKAERGQVRFQTKQEFVEHLMDTAQREGAYERFKDRFEELLPQTPSRRKLA